MDRVPILNRLSILISQKELLEGRKLPYRVIAAETGVSTSTITAYVRQTVNRFDAQTLDAFCRYFGVQPGDILMWSETDPWHERQ